MAKVSTDQDAPQIWRPVGSRQEVEDMEIPTRNIATCSAHVEGKDGNAGCPMWRNCDRAYKGSRPHFEIVRKISGSNGGVRTYAAECFNIIPKELTANDNGDLYDVIGGEGDTYLARGSVKRHVKRDPDCNDCAEGKCNTWDDVEELEHVCPTFPAAATHPELAKFARRIMARRGTSVKQKAAIRASLLGGEDDKDTDEKVGKHGRGSRS